MPRGHMRDRKRERRVIPGASAKRYIVARHDDVWLIKFDGEEYGPYNSEREAMLFAIDAAHTLGEQGNTTQVLLMDETGEMRPEWTCGLDPYPPRH